MNKNKNKQCKTHHPSDPNEKFGENPSLKSAWNGVLNFPLYLTTATYKKAYLCSMGEKNPQFNFSC